MESIENKIKQIRYRMAKIAYETKRGHLSSAYSSLEIIFALYYMKVMRYKVDDLDWNERDRFILSKGHAGLALYCVLQDVGVLDINALNNFAGKMSDFSTHPVSNIKYGIEMSAGSLGHGMAFAIGHAYNAILENKDYRVYVLLGDGELQEGSNWEAFLLVSALKLNNITVIIDYNNRQIAGKVDNIVPLGDLSKKMESFGFETYEVDGHDVSALECILKKKDKKPIAVVAHTTKGKGLSFMEDLDNWHGRGLTEEEWSKAKQELGNGE
ncbi:MAG: transketolase [Lachnospiraceae bacterium]|nr:transketolase [Lachnospiraceae bacterium]